MAVAVRRQASVSPADALLHPVALTALAILIVNDHLLKAAAPGPVTGKLSDVAGLVVAPLMVAGAWEVCRAAAGRWIAPARLPLIVAIVMTGALFCAVKVSADAATPYRFAAGYARWPIDAFVALVGERSIPGPAPALLTSDPSDLLALPALGIAWAIGRRRLP
jgi:hypothetical protein